MKHVKKDSIAPALKAMQVGEMITYTMTRYASVQNTLVVIRKQCPEKAWSTHMSDKGLEVTREK